MQNGSLQLLLGLLLACTPALRPTVSRPSQPLPKVEEAMPVAAQVPYYVDKKLRTDDWVYENAIRTVLLYPALASNDQALPAAVTGLSNQALRLEFDELTDNPHAPFHVKILHCNADWSLSMLSDIEFLHDYNDFLISSLDYSTSTHVPYLHYRFELPTVRISGNYLLVVYREGNIKDLILSRRFLVYESLLEVAGRISPSVGGRLGQQQVDFALNYKNYSLVNPSRSVQVSLRQNYSFTLMRNKLLPYIAQETEKRLEYTFFDLENAFPGGSEYRFFDIRSLRSPGVGVDRLRISADSNRVWLIPQTPRTGQPYSAQQELDGNFVIDRLEGGDPSLSADYAQVHFSLKAQAGASIYIYGALTGWQLLPDALMHYQETSGLYEGELLLKQGFYNYLFASPTANGVDIAAQEGSHFETQNQYEIIVYYRPPAARNDLIVGYAVLQANPRR